jgi:hypothetical protein
MQKARKAHKRPGTVRSPAPSQLPMHVHVHTSVYLEHHSLFIYGIAWVIFPTHAIQSTQQSL